MRAADRAAITASQDRGPLADRAKVAPIAKQVTDAYIAGLEAKGKKARAFYGALVAEMAKVKAEGASQ